MKRCRILIATAACALALLPGCASLSQLETPLSAIALVGVPEPGKLSVTVEKHPDAHSSQTRGLFYASEIFRKEHVLANAFKPAAFAPAAELTEAFAEAFRRPGRTVVRAANPQRDREDFLADYAALGMPAGVYVDIIPRSVGYWAESPTGAYRPWVIVAYRFHDSREGKLLASGLIGTGPTPAGGTAVSVALGDPFACASFEALVADPGRAVVGLRAAIRQVALALAEKL